MLELDLQLLSDAIAVGSPGIFDEMIETAKNSLNEGIPVAIGNRDGESGEFIQSQVFGTLEEFQHWLEIWMNGIA